jgi:hypothetical protein
MALFQSLGISLQMRIAIDHTLMRLGMLRKDLYLLLIHLHSLFITSKRHIELAELIIYLSMERIQVFTFY